MTEAESLWVVTVSTRDGSPIAHCLCAGEALAKQYALEQVDEGRRADRDALAWRYDGKGYAQLQGAHPVVELRKALAEWCEITN